MYGSFVPRREQPKAVTMSLARQTYEKSSLIFDHGSWKILPFCLNVEQPLWATYFVLNSEHSKCGKPQTHLGMESKLLCVRCWQSMNLSLFLVAARPSHTSEKRMLSVKTRQQDMWSHMYSSQFFQQQLILQVFRREGVKHSIARLKITPSVDMMEKYF